MIKVPDGRVPSSMFSKISTVTRLPLMCLIPPSRRPGYAFDEDESGWARFLLTAAFQVFFCLREQFLLPVRLQELKDIS